MKRVLFSVGILALTTGVAAAQQQTPKKAGKPTKAAAPIVCAVMKEKVSDPTKAAFSMYKGQKYVFCCPGCKPEFDKNPAKYAKAEAKPVKPTKINKKKA